MSERVDVPPMPEPPPDYRDDYIKAQLSRAVYYDREQLIKEMPKPVQPGAMLPYGWSLLGDDRKDGTFNFKRDDTSGFVAAAFEGPDGQIVIAFRGSDDGADWNPVPTREHPYVGPNPVLGADSDLLKELGVPAKTDKTSQQLADGQEWAAQKLGLPTWNPQFTQALDFVAEIQHRYPGRKIEVTGHSLGGALAQLASYTYGLDGRAFDPAGARNLLDYKEYADYRHGAGIERNSAAREMGLPMHEPDFVNYAVKDSLVSHKTGPHIYNDNVVEISSLHGRHGFNEHADWAIGKVGAKIGDALDILPPGIGTITGLKPGVTALRAAHELESGELIFKAMAESDTLNRHSMGRIADLFKEAAETGKLPTFGQVEIEPAVSDRTYAQVAPTVSRMSAVSRGAQEEEREEPGRSTVQPPAPSHSDRALADVLRAHLPPDTSDEMVAHAALEMKKGGIDRPGLLKGVTVQDGVAYIDGNTPGDRAKINLAAKDVPPLERTLEQSAAFDKQQAEALDQFMTEQQQINETAPRMVMAMQMNGPGDGGGGGGGGDGGGG